ncbi:MAG: DUF6538 domain-containing protein [Brevundimonas sp.]|uniref:DUF6538 domain-containing protein n=1 Tax=Brevundimonas sp. TaxID=1871086 RepID=UPI004034EF37
MPTGLRRRGARYYVIRRVPQDLVESYGRQAITKSLGTADYPEAKKRLALEWVRFNREFDEARRALGVVSGQANKQSVEPVEESRGLNKRSGTVGFAGIINLMKASLEGVTSATETGYVATPSRADEGADTSAAKGLTWDRLVHRWAAERTPAAKTRKAHESVAMQFLELVGKEPGSITRSDVILFKDKLVEKGISAANLKTKLSRLKTLINYGHENRLITEKAADGVKAPKSKVKARVPFDDSALQRLFNGPVHKDGKRPLQGRGEAAFWLPLIALFSGARLEEIAGLRVNDLIELGYDAEDGTAQTAWFFQFAPDLDANRTLKNDDSERTTPVHPELVRLGLLRYADTVRASGETQLFPRLTAHQSGKRAHKWGQWFSGYLRADCGVTDQRKVYHSFRHTLKDAGRESGVSEELQRAIMGHSPKGVAGSYGLGFSRRRIVEGMNSIRIPGLPTIEPPA